VLPMARRPAVGSSTRLPSDGETWSRRQPEPHVARIFAL
jgi:hypothetical protein